MPWILVIYPRNSEYDDAKNEQAFVEGRIATLEKILRNAKLIERNPADGKNGNTVAVGATVTLLDLDSNEELVFTLVGSPEADPSEAKISNESPVGKAIIGRQEGRSWRWKYRMAPSGTRLSRSVVR